MSFILRYSLFQALLVYVIVPLAAALALAGYISLITIEKNVEEKMQDEVQLVARALQLPLSHALERGRTMSIIRALESAFQINRVYAVSVYGRNGNMIASVGASVWDHNVRKKQEQIADMAEEGDKQEEYGLVGGQKAYSYFVPLTDSGGRINGLLQLSRKKEDFRKHIAELRFQFGIILLAGTAVMTLLVVFGHRNALGRHLERLGRSMRRVEQGDRAHRLYLRGPKEIQALASTFNTMLDSMDQAQKDLEEHRQEQARLETELRKAEKLAAVGRLAAGVAHELGTPLSIVAGQAQRAERSSDLPGKVVQSLKHIREQVGRMESIVRQLLDFSRNRPSCLREVNPAHAVHKTLKNMRPLAEEQNVYLEKAVSATEKNCQILADPLRLEQMLTNLVQNAVQAVPQGTGHILITWECTDESCIFTIQDNGPGIPSDLASRVCDPFFTTKPVGEGTGLGLAVVHGIVEEHHGSLHIETSPMGGAQIRIMLPRTCAHSKAIG